MQDSSSLLCWVVAFWQARIASGPWRGDAEWSAEACLSAVQDALFSVVQSWSWDSLTLLSLEVCQWPGASRPMFPRRDHAVWCGSGSRIDQCLLMVEKCCPVCPAISLRDTFFLIRVRILAFSTFDNCLAGMMESMEKKMMEQKGRWSRMRQKWRWGCGIHQPLTIAQRTLVIYHVACQSLGLPDPVSF